MAEKQKLEDVLKSLEKDYGKGAVLHGHVPSSEVEVIDTGSIGLNSALGVGGVPVGKIIEIFGWESSGKSTLCQTIVGNAQRKGIKCIYVDAENSIDASYSKALGMNLDDLYMIQMDESAGEGAYNKVDRLVETGEFGLVIYDSYNALQPKSVVEGEVGDSAIGKHARMLGQAVMKANYLASKHNCTFIFIGQLREKIGVMYGSPQTTQGGNALKFYSHVRMEIVRSTTKDNSIMNGDQKLGNKVTIKVIKNKMGAPFTSAEIDVIYGVGFDKIGELVDMAKEEGIIKLRAGVVTYSDQKYKEEDFRSLIEDNPDFMNELKTKILNALSNPKKEVENESVNSV